MSNFNIGESNDDPFYGIIDNMGDGGGYTITLTTSVSEPTPFKLSITVPIVHTLDNKYLNGELLIRGDGIGSILLNGKNAQLRAFGKYAVAEGFLSNATGDYSHAEGGSIASGYQSHSEGFSQASEENAHAEGNSQATGYCSHSEGKWTTASGVSSHTEGIKCIASGAASHAEGQNTTASGLHSHSEGDYTTASGDESHAEGAWTTASGAFSHAEGFGTTANHQAQHAFGIYNIPDANAANADKKGTYIEIVGNGASKTNCSNARTLDWNGNEWIKGNLKIGGTGYNDANAKEVATKEYVDTMLAQLEQTLIARFES